ncbi:histone-lysine N-methyltransferase ATX2-like isoform X2 [Pistacia vera]|uniref:histone-lysine N-methyltransferase ATX2-like isoform X2 n=1 Tax=Pistacia vera TaxID=55513 RepID=UPI00126345F1|nr:histone-lysine N-methyltransferase ATX2-like isoform X2 [Pistacia vera]
MAFHLKQQDDDTNIDIHNTGTPLRYASLDRVYSACVSSSASGSSNVMSKKVKARKLVVNHLDDSDFKLSVAKPPIVHVYSRRSSKHPHSSYFKSLLSRQTVKHEICELEDKIDVDLRVLKKRRLGSSELEKLGVDSSVLRSFNGPRLRDCRNSNKANNFNLYSASNSGSLKRKQRDSKTILSISSTTKRWVRLSFDGVDPKAFIGLQCKVFWPLDADWYSGCVVGCDSESNRHYVKYEDGDEEDLILSNEKIKFYISQEEIDRLKLTVSANNMDNDGYDYNEMVVLAATLDDCQEPEPGDIIWAKLTGHSMWPAVVVEESLIGDHKGLNKILGGRSVPVQFFGTHDFARINVKQVISFLKGLLSSFHLKCKKPRFTRSLEEAKVYLSEQKLPRRMLLLRNGMVANVCENTCSEDEGRSDSGEVCIKDERIQGTPGSLGTSPYVVGDLQIISLGKIVKDSEYFQDDRFIWPEGYTAIRKFTSITDPSVCSSYKMEVLRDPESNSRPLFRVTMDGNEQFNGSTPSACWNKIYRRLRKKKNNSSDGLSADGGVEKNYESGHEMFGFSNPEVMKLIKGLSKSRYTSKFSMCKLTSGRCRDLPAGYRPVRVDWKDLDKCSVCHMDEEYEDNLFLQCDKCRMMVHARCYGELEPVDGVLWLCNLCCPGAPESPPPCCLCPVIGGAMKPTTDGRWAHLACAIWIPETCLSDVKRMEPIDGLDRINKDRWKLLCSICGVSYGACIQCSNSTCRVAYHPLCARAAGLCVELEDEDRLNLLSFDEDDEDQCIRLLSFCKKHRQPSNDRLAIDERVGQITRRCCDYSPPSNPSGCARSEPYNNFGRRGRKEPEALAAASLKRLFVENQPYLVGRYCQHGLSENILPSVGVIGSKFSFSIHRDAHTNILSMAEKYKYMRETFRKRLAFGKSAIHGFGIFAKHPHRAGDMVK